MPYIPPNRCYVYSSKKNTCGMCHRQLILKRYSVSTRKGKLIDNQGRYCANCNAFVIKYGTYLANKKNWIVLNIKELQELEELRRKQKEYLEEVTLPSVKTVDPVDTYHLRMENIQKELISLGLLRTPSPQVNNASRVRHKDANDDYIITAHDFVVRRAVFKCMHNNHHIEDVKAVFTTISSLGTVNKITIPAGYCSTCNMYFIMESTYKKIKKSGIPICRTVDEKNYLKNNISGMHYNGLASESVLMQFGYNVSQKDDLPAEQRRRILAAIVDNGVLKRNEVISYLDYFINQRKNQKNKDGSLRYKDAMDKWRMDRAWINKYKLGSYKEVLISSIV